MHIPSLEIFSIMWNFPSQCLSSKGNSRDWLCLVWKSTNERMDPLWRFNMQLFGTLLYTIWRLFSTLRLKEFGPTFYFREEVHAFRHIKVVLENTLHIISCEISVLFGTFCLLNVLNFFCLGDVSHWISCHLIKGQGQTAYLHPMCCLLNIFWPFSWWLAN